MAVLDPDAPAERRAHHVNGSDTPGAPSGSVQPADKDRAIHIEPLVELEWRRAVEPTGPIGAARRPGHARRAWIHRAPESQVVKLYDSTRAVVDELPAPWWLRALAAGRLQSRLGGFAVEDQVSDVLDARSGWMYMPWTGPGEDGYWEYLPAERPVDTAMMPTTIMFTDRHSGWLDVVLAHAGPTPQPLAIASLTELRARLPELERA
jgi:hypothetical protein